VEVEERVSLFFINRPIKQGRRLSPAPASMFYFVRPLFRAHARFFLPQLRLPVLATFVLVSFGLIPFFLPFRVSVRPPFGRSRSVFRRETLRPRGDSPFVALGPEQFSFCYFIQLFREREESFYYLGARLQCLANNKPMKATFEPEGPLKSSSSPTSRSFTLAFSLPLFRFVPPKATS